MRLEVQCKDRLGLTRELLDILASQNIDLRDIEINKAGLIYLNFPEVAFDEFSQLMAKIRRIEGVIDVRKIPFLPSERRNMELLAVLSTLPDPVFAINLKGKIDNANQAVASLFNRDKEALIGEPANVLLPNFNVMYWLEESRVRQRESMDIEGMNYVMEIMPVYITDDDNTSILASAVVIIKPAMDSTLARPFIPESSNLGFEHFVGSSTKYKTLISQAKKLSDIDQSLLIQGETGTGKEMLARACHNASIRSGKAFMVVNCAAMPDDVRAGAMHLRDLIFDVAADLPEVGPISEELRWGQPAYLTPTTKAGSTLRLGAAKGGGFAIFAHCQTTIISDFAAAFPATDQIDGNRAVVFQTPGDVDPARHGMLIRAGLTYHL